MWDKRCFWDLCKRKDRFDGLVSHLKKVPGFSVIQADFFSKKTHLASLEKALELVTIGVDQLQKTGAGELLAEDLRQAQNELSEITDSSPQMIYWAYFLFFCIGK